MKVYSFIISKLEIKFKKAKVSKIKGAVMYMYMYLYDKGLKSFCRNDGEMTERTYVFVCKYSRKNYEQK